MLLARGFVGYMATEVVKRLVEGELIETKSLESVTQRVRQCMAEELGVEDRLAGTLAVTAVGAWLGARIFRAHDVAQTRQALDMVGAVRGDLLPARTVRGLA